MAYSEGIRLKKELGQHFLRDPLIPLAMVEAVHITPQSSIFEIGCGDGFLTQVLLQTPAARVRIFEIDAEWASYVRQKFSDVRLEMKETNFLDVDLEKELGPEAPWIVLANLPYQITFPIFHKFYAYRHLLQEGVVMIQEEVAEKLTKKRGRGYGFPALFFQHYFDFKLLNKIPPSSFFPPPKVHSRLLYFKPRAQVVPIEREEEFWKFIKMCFQQPRRTLRNNLMHTPYLRAVEELSEKTLNLRAQQMSEEDFLAVWKVLIK